MAPTLLGAAAAPSRVLARAMVAAAALLTLGLVLPGRAPPVARPAPSMMAGAAAQQVDGVRVGPPNTDLPSLLLNNRIVYIGMPLAPSVTELVVAELLFLNYDNPEKNVFMYINSPGRAERPPGDVVRDPAFAIPDTMTYIAPEVETICLGTAFRHGGDAVGERAEGEAGVPPEQHHDAPPAAVEGEGRRRARFGSRRARCSATAS